MKFFHERHSLCRALTIKITILVCVTTGLNAFADDQSQSMGSEIQFGNPPNKRQKLEKIARELPQQTAVPPEVINVIVGRYLQIETGTYDRSKPAIRSLFMDIDGAGQGELIAALARITATKAYTIDLGHYASGTFNGQSIFQEIANIYDQDRNSIILLNHPERAAPSVQLELATILKNGSFRRNSNARPGDLIDCQTLKMFFVVTPVIEVLPPQAGPIGFMAKIDTTPKQDNLSITAPIIPELLSQMTEITPIRPLNAQEYLRAAFLQLDRFISEMKISGLNIDPNSFRKLTAFFVQNRFVDGLSRAEIGNFLNQFRHGLAVMSLRPEAHESDVYVASVDNSGVRILPFAIPKSPAIKCSGLFLGR